MKSLSVFIAAAAAVALAAVGFMRGTYAAGGSDSSCYALMADAFASGTLQPSSVLEPQVPWPDASKTFAPGGFVPSHSNPAAAAPVCAPGFSVLLAPFVKLGGPTALFAFTPIAGALLVWLAFLAARALAGPIAGAMAAVVVAASPIVLFQVVQPMNDITTAMLWMAVFVALISRPSTHQFQGRSGRPERATRVEGRRWAVAGVCCGLALLVRPNLLPLGLVAGVYVLLPQGTAELKLGPDAGAFRRGIGRAVAFGSGAAPFVLLIFWLNWSLYGGPLKSGYGQLANLFSLANIAVNAGRYSRWLVDTQTPFPFLALFAPFLVDRKRRAAAVLALGLAGATAAVYLIYTPFDDWSYLRFLLPALIPLLVLASVCVATLAENVRGRTGVLMAAAVTAAYATFCVRAADDRFAFVMRALEQRYRSAGIVARDRLPPNAAVLTTWDSGAIRFHGRKEAIVWDALDPDWLDHSLDWLSQHGHPPFLLLESWEEPRFRARFSERSLIGKLDWPPKYEVDRVVRIYDPADRARYLRGERIGTQYVWPLKH